jgi:hypothetical protein
MNRAVASCIAPDDVSLGVNSVRISIRTGGNINCNAVSFDDQGAMGQTVGSSVAAHHSPDRVDSAEKLEARRSSGSRAVDGRELAFIQLKAVGVVVEKIAADDASGGDHGRKTSACARNLDGGKCSFPQEVAVHRSRTVAVDSNTGSNS